MQPNLIFRDLGWLFSLIGVAWVMGIIGAVWTITQQNTEYQRLMAECMKDHQEYECVILLRSGDIEAEGRG